MTCPTPVHSTIDVRLEADARDGAGVVGRPEGTNELRLGPRFDPVEDVDFEPALLSDQGRQKTDRPSAGDEHGPRLPEGALADRAHLLPRLGDDGRGLEQHAEQAERWVDLHRVLGLDPPALGHEPVDLLDAALGVLAVAAHVPLAHRAVGARHGVGPPDDADHEIALLERAVRARVHHAAQGLVPEHQARLAARRPPVLALHDLDVGPADADRDGFHEDRPVACVGLGDVLEACGSRACAVQR